ncbi:MAG: heavy metal translocating P-type ATPase [Synergistaceae bacterium]|nr:heavy metal translocating P-type ATPase [Synergistaceae bacterium]
MRLRCPKGSFTRAEACVVGEILKTQTGVLDAAVSHRTGGVLIYHEKGAEASIIEAARRLDKTFYSEIAESLTETDERSLADLLFSMFAGITVRTLLPAAVRYPLIFLRSLPLLGRGLRSLLRDVRLNISVLDAAAVGTSMLRRDFSTASVITTLLALGDLLENWTRKKSRESLADSLALNVDMLWVRRDGREIGIPMRELRLGDLAVVRSGSVIPVDGVVFEGDAMVNQASMTGESEPVHRTAGLSVYAGTIVEAGELVIRVTAFDSETRLRKIAELIEKSEELKANIQSRAEKMADSIVPYSFLLAAGIYLCTRDAARAASALMVDYSCAIKLSTPLVILSAMREAARRGALVKGGKFLETLAFADIVVFDKTGTLTVSAPNVAKIIPFGGRGREEVLRTAACLEEHFPHSVARAVVKQAERENISHAEEHSTVEYAVAHGIASWLRGEKVLIGSAHFVLEDEGVCCTAEQREILDRETAQYSVLLLAAGKKLAGVLCIEDPLREDAGGVVKRLRQEGISRIVMLTGDNARVADSVARRAGIGEVRAELLPEDKARIVKELKSEGRVIMVGDGINDSPALAAADMGIAMRGAADIARETADVALSENRLSALIDLRKLGRGTVEKIYRNFAWIIGANSILLALGLTGIITPAMSALIHNMSTIASGIYSLKPVLKQNHEDGAQL